MVRLVHKLFKLNYNKKIEQLPSPYIDFMEKYREPAERVHDDAPETKYLDYNQDHETGYVYRVPDQRIPVTYPKNARLKGLWGGLGMVEGFEKPKRMKPRINRLWYPKIEKHTFYSEILDCHINVEVTERTLELIDQHKGFDYYILATRPQDLKSFVGVRLQRKMLLVLSRNPSDYLKQKYKDYIRPIEEVEWHGLIPSLALTKARLLRIEETIEPPLKLTYGQKLIEQLKETRNQLSSQ